ncbi:MAG: hypothetical protein ACRD0D_10795 [Acidimicrobiales bacterium]
MLSMSATLRHRWWLTAASVIVAALIGACGTGDSGSASDTASRPRVAGGVIEGLCRARQQAGDDPGAAKATFFDTAHQGLHELARSLEEVDRGAAADVLRAKQMVEADLETEDRDLATDLDALVAETSAGFDALGLPAPSCEASR